MEFVFDEQKAAQAAAYLLRRHGGPMPVMTLLHLLYLLDRRQLIETGSPATGDRLLATPYGPVPARILDLLTWGSRDERSPWREHVAPPADHCVTVAAPETGDELTDYGRLSEYDHEVMGALLDKFGALDQWALAGHLRALPEWSDPGCGATEIDPRSILVGAGYSNDELEHAEEQAAAVRWLHMNFVAAE